MAPADAVLYKQEETLNRCLLHPPSSSASTGLDSQSTFEKKKKHQWRHTLPNPQTSTAAEKRGGWLPVQVKQKQKPPVCSRIPVLRASKSWLVLFVGNSIAAYLLLLSRATSPLASNEKLTDTLVGLFVPAPPPVLQVVGTIPTKRYCLYVHPPP